MRSFLRGVARRLRRTSGRPPAPSRPAPPRHLDGPPRHLDGPPRHLDGPPRHLDGPPRGRHLVYAPDLDGRADPGEIVWFWVPYEDDPQQGKDRPVLVVGRDRHILLGLMLSSQSARDGQADWFALGAGDWDHDARPSWVRLDRVLAVPEAGIRREGAVLDRPRFEAVARELRGVYGWA